jgi:putative phage-type endonuclease
VVVTAPAIQQRSQAWHELRRVSIGSSDLPVLAGFSPWKSEYELAMEKLGAMPPEVREGVDPRLVGELLEPGILELYRRQTGHQAKAQHGVRQHPDLPWAIASLDAVTINERPNRIVELKHSYAAKWRGDRLPEDVEVQVVWQMGVSGYWKADVCALVYGLPRIYELTYDPAYFDDLVRLAERFRAQLDAGQMPEPDGTDSARRAIVTRFPADDGTWLRPSDELVAIAHEIRDAEREAKAAADREATAKNAMRALLGEASGVGSFLIDGFEISHKRSKDSVTIAWQQVAEDLGAALDERALPDAVASHTTTKPGSRRLLARFDQAEGGDRP